MNEAEYMAMQSRVELLCRLILDTDPDDLRRFIEAGERSNAIAPLLDPSAWIRGTDALTMVMEHARAIAKARRSIAEAAERSGALPVPAVPVAAGGGPGSPADTSSSATRGGPDR